MTPLPIDPPHALQKPVATPSFRPSFFEPLARAAPKAMRTDLPRRPYVFNSSHGSDRGRRGRRWRPAGYVAAVCTDPRPGGAVLLPADPPAATAAEGSPDGRFGREAQ